MKRLLVISLVALGLTPALWSPDAHAQPVPVTWRPPTTCSDGQFLKWDLAQGKWVCGTAGAIDGSGTGGHSVRWVDADTQGDGAFTDDGTNASIGGSLHTINPSGSANLVIGTSTKDWTWYMSGNDLTLHEYTGSFGGGGGTDWITVAAGGTLDFNGDLAKFGATDGDGSTYIYRNQINSGYAQDVDGYVLRFNYVGYALGGTRFRDTEWLDGKGNQACYLTGSTKVLNCVGGLQENGTAVLSGSITGNVIPKGSSGNLVDSNISDDGTNVTITRSGGTGSEGVVTRFDYTGSGAQLPAIVLASNGVDGLKLAHNNSFAGAVLDNSFVGATEIALAVRGVKGLTIDNNSAVSIPGSTTLGDAVASDTTTINGNTVINGKGSGTVALQVGTPGSGGGTVLELDAAGMDNGIFVNGAPATQFVTAGDTTPTFNFFDATNTTLSITNSDASAVANVSIEGALSVLGSSTLGDNGASDTLTIHAKTTSDAFIRVTTTAGGDGFVVGTSSKQWDWYPNGSNLNLWEFTTTLEAGGGADRISIAPGGAVTFTSTIQATKVKSETQLADYTRGFEIYNEFLNVPTSSTLTGGATGAFDGGFSYLGGFGGIDAEANRPGILTLRAYTSTDTIGGSPAPRYARVIAGSGAVGGGWFAGGGAAKFAGSFEIWGLFSPPVDDSDSYSLHIGLLDDNTQNGATADFPPNGIYCRVGSASTNVQVCTAEADTQSCTDTSPTIAIAEDAWYRCEFTVNAAGTQVDFTVTNVTAGTSGTASRTTNIPNDDTHPVGVGATVDSIDNAGTGAVFVDYLWFDQTFTTAR